MFKIHNAKHWAIIGLFTILLSACAQNKRHSYSNLDVAEMKATSVSQTESLKFVVGLEEPLIATANTTPEENHDLEIAISQFQESASSDLSRHALRQFVENHPQSAWNMSVLTNLGFIYYREGYFTKALDAWSNAWTLGKNATDRRARALTDRAVGELARMHARLGHQKELEVLFDDMGDRAVSGAATELITGAKEGLWMFENDPGVSFLCGPKALKNLLISLNADTKSIEFVDEQRSEPGGYTLSEVSALADEINFTHKLVYRNQNEPIPVPSIVNWKLSHYAVILEQKGDRYLVKDPTFATGDSWVSEEAINQESSGYFLVPSREDQQFAWRYATKDETDDIYGMGYTSANEPEASKPCDKGLGMCVSDAKAMLVSLSLNDTPHVYAPPIGPTPQITLTYNQREAYQPSIFSFFNVSPKWTMNMLSWVQDNPNSAGSSVLRYVAGGGAINYASGYSYSAATGEFSPERQSQSILKRIPATGVLEAYELLMPDGSMQVFSFVDGSNSYPRRVFLSQIVDPAGNILALHYDDNLRLTKLVDATGRETLLSYELENEPLLVTKITDPFGRAATLSYNANGQLETITDIIGITSTFAYDASGLVNAMTTPYGSSSYVYGSGSSNSRYLERTDAMGYTDRLEFRHLAPGMPYSESPIPDIGVDNRYLYYRNTFYWDKNIYPTTHSDYTKAWLTHWLHNAAGQTSPIIESTKAPLERRVWRKYPNQPNGFFEGTTGTPIAFAKVLDDGTTQSVHLTYNRFGKPLTSTDPQGRITRYTYDTNDIDLLKLERLVANSVYETIAAFTYNSQHLPLTYTDEAGQIWSFTYNGAGQINTQTNPLLEVTTYEYDALGYLETVKNANDLVESSFTYDDWGRVASQTDSEGHKLVFEYDNFDRVTKVTYPDETTELYSYNNLDMASYTDRLGRLTTYSYDANRRLTSITDPLNRTTTYGYYPGGELKTLTDTNGNVTTWQRDLQGRVTAKIYANGDTTSYAYETTTSRLKSITDALGQIKTFSYTIDDRVTNIAYTNTVNPTSDIAYAWDTYYPLLKSMSDGNGDTNYSYYSIGENGALKLSVADGPFNNDDVSYSYDALGRVLSQNISGAPQSYAYDPLGRLSSSTNEFGTFAYGYLGQSDQLATQSLAGSPVTTAWDYEDNQGDRRLKSIANFGLARSFGLTTTPESIISKIIETANGQSKTWNYEYDDANRLLNAQASSGQDFDYAYDDNDNLSLIDTPTVTTNLAYDSVNQIDEDSFAYDANGNLLEDEKRTYAWDAENRLITIYYKNEPDRYSEFKYDGNGLRVAIIEHNGTAASETRYGWCGDTICQARTENDTVTRAYYDEGEVWTQNGAKLLYATDQIGSVRDVLLAPNGARIAAYDYDPYGNKIAAMGRVLVDFGYAGMFYHKGSGLYLTQYRVYDPETARWLSRDPIGEDGGLNLYGYVGGEPTLLNDPTGQCPICLLMLAGAAEGAIIDLGLQLAGNGGNWSCVDWGEVGLGALLGAGTNGILGAAGKFYNSAGKFTKGAAKGMNNPKVKSAAARGREAHKEFAERVRQKPGWKSEKTITGPNGEKLRPDALTPSGRPVELKPNTPSGRKQGAKQIEKYKEATGTNGRVIYYDP